MLAKLRHYVTPDTLRVAYHAIFSSLLTYGAEIWGQNSNKFVKRIIKLQDKAIRIINFAHYNSSRGILYKQSKVLKFKDYVNLKNFLFVHDCLKGNAPTALTNKFELRSNVHLYSTRVSLQHQVSLPKARTQISGIKSISYQSSHIWNQLISRHTEKDLLFRSKDFCKCFIKQELLNSY